MPRPDVLTLKKKKKTQQKNINGLRHCPCKFPQTAMLGRGKHLGEHSLLACEEGPIGEPLGRNEPGAVAVINVHQHYVVPCGSAMKEALKRLLWPSALGM